jgi:hypothetical protein
VNYFAAIFLDGAISDDDKGRFVDFLENPPMPPGQQPPDFALTHDTFSKGVRDMMHVMMAMPEYQLA